MERLLNDLMVSFFNEATGALCENGLDHLSSDVGEAEAAAVVGVGEFFVIESELVENGGVDVVNVGFVDGGVVADFIRLAVADPAFDSASGHPGGEAVRVVIAAGFGGFLGKRQASEFAPPNDEGVLKEAALFEVGEKTGDGGVGLAGELAVVAFDVIVAVPAPLVFHAAGVDLHEADPALDHAAGSEALAGEVVAMLLADTVELLDVFGFAIDVEGFGRGALHAVGEFEAFDACFEFGIAGAFLNVIVVE